MPNLRSFAYRGHTIIVRWAEQTGEVDLVLPVFTATFSVDQGTFLGVRQAFLDRRFDTSSNAVLHAFAKARDSIDQTRLKTPEDSGVLSRRALQTKHSEMSRG
jgi:hypothetical protein